MSAPNPSTPEATRHTPLPWHRNIAPARKYTTIFAGRNKHVCHLETVGLTDAEIEANAELIVRAVNSYDDMLAALKSAHKLLTKEHFDSSDALAERCAEIGAVCEKAIAVAERGQ